MVLSTINRVCVTLHSLVALRYTRVLEKLAATPAVVRVTLRRRLFELERGGDLTLLRLIVEYAMRWPWAIDSISTLHTRYPLIWSDVPREVCLTRSYYVDTSYECKDPTPFAHLVHSPNTNRLPQPHSIGRDDIAALNLLEGLPSEVLAVAEELDLSQLCLDWITKLKPRQQALFPFMNVSDCLLVNNGCNGECFNFDARCNINDLEDRLGLLIGELMHSRECGCWCVTNEDYANSPWVQGQGPTLIPKEEWDVKHNYRVWTPDSRPLPPGALQEIKKMSDEQTPYADIFGAATAADLRRAYLAVKSSKYNEWHEMLCDVSVELRPATRRMGYEQSKELAEDPEEGLVVLTATGTNFMPPSPGHLRGHPDCDGSSSVSLVIIVDFDHGS